MNIPTRFMNGKYSRFTPVVVFNYSQLKEFFENMDSLKEDLETLRISMRDATKYPWDNNHFRFSNIYGDEFAFYVGDDNYFVFWNANGGTQLGALEITNPRQDLNYVLEITQHYSCGEKKCSDCGKWVSIHEADRHRYFASTFCLDCWERKWKAIEAKENYE